MQNGVVGVILPAFEVQGSGIPIAKPARVLQGISAGPLLLWEPGNPEQPSIGIPADGSNLIDIALDQTTQTLSAVPAPLTIQNQIVNGGPFARFERTAAGGYHVMQSQSTQTTAYQLFRMQLGATRLNWINTHPNHTYYCSVWARKTRQFKVGYTGVQTLAGIRSAGDPDGTTDDSRWLNLGASSTSNHYNVTPTSPDTRSLGTRVVDLDGGNTLMLAGSANAPKGAATAAIDRFVGLGPSSSGKVNNYPSIILYRIYLEDLTVSGRSFTTVADIDQSEFTDQVLTFGGRYFLDTLANNAWNDPALVLP